MKSPQHAVHSACGMYIKTPGKRMEKRLPGSFIYLPVNTGFLFSKNAFTASAWSAE